MISFPRSVKAITASFHPSYAWKRRTPQLVPQIVHTIRRARQIPLKGIQRCPVTVRFLTRAEELRQYLTAATGLPASIDIETPRSNPHHITIVAVSCRPGEGVVFHYDEEFGDVLAELLSDTSRLKLGQNFAFDQHAFIANGAEPKMPIADTIIAEALLCPPFKEAKKMRWLSLATAVARRVPGWAYHKEPDNPKTRALYSVWFPNVPAYQYPLLYCALDAIATLLLWNAQKRELIRTGQFDIFRDVLCPAAFTLVKLEARGIPIDDVKRRERIERARETIKDLGQKVIDFTTTMHRDRKEKCEAAIADLVAERKAIGNVKAPESKALTPKVAKLRTKLKQIGDEFKPTNDNHWRWLLFSTAGLNLVPTRISEKSGMPGVKKDDIEQLRQLYPDVGVLAWRVDLKGEARRKKLFETLVPDVNGRAHFAFAIHRTENGRFSGGEDDSEEDKLRESEGGNPQNLSEQDREIFVAPEGKIWLDFDMKQVELLDMAWIAKEWPLIELLRAGLDIHSENGAAIFGCTREEARKFKVRFSGRDDTARQGGKKASHSWDYGAGDKKTGDTFRPFHGLPYEEVIAFLADVNAKNRESGVSADSLARRERAVANSADPEGEKRKLRMKLYEMANTFRAREWRINYFRKWPRLAAFQKEIVAKVEEDRELRNSFGRVLKFWNFKWDFENKRSILLDREEALAFWPASDVGDMAKVLLPLMDECATRHGGELVTTTHDSFSILMPNDPERVCAFAVEAKAIMERKWPQFAPHPKFRDFWVPCDISIGRNWGKKTESNPDGLEEYRLGA
jgi:DNA polymerase I-like protein with 3'-5' exonuclease and polymerase domains